MRPSLQFAAVALALLPLVVAADLKQPNIIFILTDDMDWHMEAMDHMPLLQKYLVQEGTTYSNHYCTVALCCPSRVNLWTGKAAHNTNVTDVWAPYGGYPKVVRQGINDDYLPHWMQAAGYNTYYAGKLWNHHTTSNYNNPYAGGFNGSDFLLDPHTYQYRNATMTRNGAPPVNYAGRYSPDVTAEKAEGFLREALSHHDPFFLVHAPIAPHGTVELTPRFLSDMPGYDERFAHLFTEYKIPRDANFNPDKQGGVSWIKQLPKLNDTVIEYNDEYQRARLRSLQSVDEQIERIIKILEDANELENTYIFYTTDNGYHISQHRMYPGKECGFETDVHIPLVVRGPGVAAGHVSTAVTSHTDLASTMMEIAGKPLADSDGLPIPLTPETSGKGEHVGIEYWGLAIPEGIYGKYGDGSSSKEHFGTPGRGIGNNTYKAVRIISEEYNLYYSVWCTHESELYDLKTDPDELINLLDEENESQHITIAGRPLEQVIDRLDALIMVLKSCKGKACVEPWKEFNLEGSVFTLKDSLAPKYDNFFATQTKVRFSECQLGYILDAEGPMEFKRYGEELNGESWWWKNELKRDEDLAKYRGPWSVWT